MILPRLFRTTSFRASPFLALAALLAATPFAMLFSEDTGAVTVAQTQQATPAQSRTAQARTAQSQPAAPAGPVKTETQSFDNWVLTCQEVPPAAGAKTGKKTCFAVLRITDNQSKRVVVVWKIGRDGKDVPTIAITTPTGVLVRDGVDLVLGQNTRKLAYQWCNGTECEASIAYDAALAKELSAAKEATIAFRLQDGRQVNVKVGVTGVDKVLAGLAKS
ncbi:invasion associated locus B family protein [Xanthobacter aminoxidans]|uniref:invasion associated locus B family protein n=1 Tax=Xanthobacter aminoxidans TaxID=186280 RepID=UPI00372984A9